MRICISLLPVWALLAFLGDGKAQDPVSVVAGDPLECFVMEGAPASDLRVVPVDGMPFGRAMRIRTGEVNPRANDWDIRPRCFNTLPVRQGDTLLATFWMRTLRAPKHRGYAIFVVEKGASPWTKSIRQSVGAGEEWNKVEIPFSAAESYGAGGRGANGYNISFWVVFPHQEIEIGGFTLVNFGAGVPFRQLGLESWPYEGHAANAAWRQAAAARIERYRKTDLVVVARDEQGRPVAGAPVRVKMRRHAFGFGTAVARNPVQAATPNGEQYRRLLPQLFNKGVTENELKWNYVQDQGFGPADAILRFLAQAGIEQIRGHVLVWPGRSYLPADVVAMLNANPVNREQLRNRIDKHIRDMLAFTKGRVTEWDVVNEPLSNHDIQDVLGNEEMVRWFQIAREADPSLKLYINEYDITEGGGYFVKRIDGFAELIAYLLQQGAPLDGIGLQSHFRGSLTPPERVWEILEQYAAFGKDLQVTEFDVEAQDEDLQAAYLRDYLTICFSHPAMKGFMVWGFWAGAHWRPEAAMFRQDWTPRKMHDVWNELIFRHWWTDVSGTTGADGAFRTRGFLGDYDIEVDVGGQTRRQRLTLKSFDEPGYITLGPAAPPPQPTAVVNAASFAPGVAPGAAVTLFGQHLGPEALQPATYDATGRLPFVVGDTRVLFDGKPSAMLYSSRNQVSALVPYAASGVARVEVDYQGVRSAPLAVTISPSAPGIYCYEGGRGQAVAVNNAAAGASFNSPQNPAPRGSYLTFFLTGEGVVTPAGEDGALPAAPRFPQPQQEWKAYFGGVESRCPHNWAGLIYAGVLQVNACVPAGAPVGPAVSLQVLINGVASQEGVTVALRE